MHSDKTLKHLHTAHGTQMYVSKYGVMIAKKNKRDKRKNGT